MKRGREDVEDEPESVAAELGTVLERGIDVKLRALDRVGEVIDHGDEIYANQIALVDAGCPFYLVELLRDETAVAIKTAKLIARLCEHSATAKARLQSGPVIGVENVLAKVLLNPVQNHFLDAGAVSALTPWLFNSRNENDIKIDAAMDALSSLTSYNHDGKIALLAALVEAFQAGTVAALEHLNDCIEGLESCDEEACRLLEGAIKPLILALRLTGKDGVKALSLVGTVCEKSNDLQLALSEHQDAIDLVTGHLVGGGNPLEMQDAAARALWHLTRGKEDVFKSEGALGRKAGEVTQRLEGLLRVSREQEEEAREEEEKGGGGGGGGKMDSWFPGDLEPAAPAQACYENETRCLLKSISSRRPEVVSKESELDVDQRNSCAVM